ncbi:sensor histidine kinase [Jeotgalibacillus aurantiacus]|uniref:sensor histidine kinase n=1 Tax=Jeotgalibacillus aurantiacus TaxID=2763266 RepID=UPI001D0B324D|nr:HAMP domain-containing sensor histidine kinase [Jeotgalibacillus aurantiacus]
MKLQNKIHLYTSAVFALLLVMISLAVYFTFSTLTYQSELRSSQATAASTAAGIASSAGVIEDQAILRAYPPANGAASIILEDNTSIGPVTSVGQNDLRNTDEVFYSEERAEIIELNGQRYTFVSIPLIWSNGSIANLQIYESLENAVNNLQILRNVLIAVTLIAFIPVIISGRLLGNVITVPIRSMIKTIKSIQQSGEFKRIHLEGKSRDELYEMGDSFNHMMSLLETNFDKQEQFVANASHELKTPLTVIESYANLVKRRGLDNREVVEESIHAIHSEAIRMKEMTQQLLLLAKHGEQWKLSPEPIYVPELLEESVQAFTNAYGREIKLTIKEGLEIEADKQKLKQLIYIFLDNAHKYSDDSIEIVSGIDVDSGYISIQDKGIGIPKDDLPKVFDRFYRVDKARTRKSGGSGLGLSLAKELSDALGLNVELNSIEGMGTVATIRISLS